jgi:ubiquinone/menaquinone biosynthesis C-methylase UbiE
LKPGETVLDLGCGGGTELLEAARLVSAGQGGTGTAADGADAAMGDDGTAADGADAAMCDDGTAADGADAAMGDAAPGAGGWVYGLDMTEEMLAFAQQRIEQSGLPNIQLLQGMIEDIPLPDASVDVVISNCVINLCDDKSLALAEAWRVLRPCGRMAIADVICADEDIDSGVADALAMVLGCTNGVLKRGEYQQILAQVGFEAASIEPYSFFGSERIREKAAQTALKTGDESRDGDGFAERRAAAQKVLSWLADQAIFDRVDGVLAAAFVLAGKGGAA